VLIAVVLAYEDEAGVEQFRLRLPADASRRGFRCAVATAAGTVLGFAYGSTASAGDGRDVLAASVAGLVGADFVEGSWALVELAVAPGAWRRGIGGRLHDAVLAATPASRAWVLTSPDAPAARGLYDGRGWSLVGRIPRRDGAGELEVRVRPGPR
jgi:ribosomal protein S18 acetylase RimI-like enzyme